MSRTRTLLIIAISLSVGLIASTLLTGLQALTGGTTRAVSSNSISALPAAAKVGPRASAEKPKGTLNPDNPLAVYETTLEKGYVKFNITLVNKGPTGLDVNVGIDLRAVEYVPWLGKEVEFWSWYPQSWYRWLWIEPGEDWSWTPEMLIIEGGSARVVISPRYDSEVPFELDYNIEVKYVAREAEYEPLHMNTTTSYTWGKAAEDVVVFRIDVPSDRLLNITVEQKSWEAVVPIVETTLRVWTWDLDEGDEEIEVYLNDHYVGAVDEAYYDVIRLPVEHLRYGSNELKFVYRELTAKADYLGLEGYEVRLRYADDYHRYYDEWPGIWMEDDGDTWTSSFYAPERRKAAEVYYSLRSLANGHGFGGLYLYGNGTGSIYAYLPKGSYCLVAERDFAAGVWLSITLEQPPIEIITPGGSAEFTFHKGKYEAFFVGVKPDVDWIHQLKLEITSGDGWRACGWSVPWEALRLQCLKSSALGEEGKRYIDMLWAFPVEITTFESPTWKWPETYWMFRGEYREEYFAPPEESYYVGPTGYGYAAPLIAFVIRAEPYGPDVTDTCTVKVSLTKKEGIPELSVGSPVTASFNTTKGPVTAVFKLSVDVGNEYTVQLEPTKYEHRGAVYSEIVVPTTKCWLYGPWWWYGYWPSYSAVNATLTVELASPVATTAYLYVEAGGDTSEMTIELVGVSEAEPLAGETTITFSRNDTLKLMKFDVKKGFTYVVEAELLKPGYVTMTFFDSSGRCVWELERKPPLWPPLWMCGYAYGYPYYVLENLKSESEGTAYLIVWGSPGAELRISITEEEKPYEEGYKKGHEEGYEEGYKKGVSIGHEEGHKKGVSIGLAGGLPGGIAIGAVAVWALLRRKAGSSHPPRFFPATS